MGESRVSEKAWLPVIGDLEASRTGEASTADTRRAKSQGRETQEGGR